MKALLKLSLVATLLMPLTACVTEPMNAKPNVPPAPVIIKQDGWVRWVPPSSRNSAAYFTIENPTLADDILVGASTPRARVAELHKTVSVGLAKSMQRVDSVRITGATRLDLNPGGYHLMLIDLTAPLQEGEKIPLTLEFKRSGKIETSFPVMMMYGGDQGADHQHHH